MTNEHINLLIGIICTLLGLHFGLGAVLAFAIGVLFHAALFKPNP
jgi:hypothetical protein